MSAPTKRTKQTKRVRPNADTLDSRPWMADVAMAYRLIFEVRSCVDQSAPYYAMAVVMVDQMENNPPVQWHYRDVAMRRLEHAVRRASREAVPS